MPDTYDDIVAAGLGTARPRGKTHPNKIAFQPDDADWSLDRLTELQEAYQSEFGRPLPVVNKGQGSVHNKMGWDHRASSDVGLNPTTPEGKRFGEMLRERKVPFLAFTGPVPGASTGPHYHLGRPSHRTSAKYNVGAQVKLTSKRSLPDTDDYADVISTAVQGTDGPSADDYSDIIAAAATPTSTGRFGAPRGSKQLLRQHKRTLAELATGGAGPVPVGPSISGTGDVRRAEAIEARGAGMGVGELRRADDPAATRFARISQQVTAEQTPAERAMGRAPGTATARLLEPHLNESEEVIRRAASEESTERQNAERIARFREITSQFTEEDKAAIARDLQRMQGMGTVSRGIETGSQRVGSGILYKLAALSDVALGTKEGVGKPLGNYLRRQAARGEVTIEDINAEIPPEAAEQWADFLTHSLGALPEIFGATAVAGPVGGFAALGALEAGGRNEPATEVIKEGVKGAFIGKVFQGAGRFESPGAAIDKSIAARVADTAKSGAAIGVGTFAVEKGFGASDADAARAAVANVAFHTAGRAPEIVSRFTSAAERVLKSPAEPSVREPVEAPKAKVPEAPVAPVVETASVPAGRSTAVGTTAGEVLQPKGEPNVPAPAAVSPPVAPTLASAPSIPETAQVIQIPTKLNMVTKAGTPVEISPGTWGIREEGNGSFTVRNIDTDQRFPGFATFGEAADFQLELKNKGAGPRSVAPPSPVAPPTAVEATPPVAKRSIVDLMRERGEAGPSVEPISAPERVKPQLVGPDPVRRNADLADGPIMSKMRVGTGEVRAAAGIDPKLIPVIAKTMYAKETGTIVPKELLQNAVDAVRSVHSPTRPGKVEVDVETSMRQFKVVDNGVGMLPDVVTKEFTDLGGTLKQSMESSGGFGLAKGAMFYNAARIEVDTIARDPRTGKLIRTKVEGSGDDWLDHSKGLKVTSTEVSTNLAGAPPEWLKADTGTSVSITLKPEAKMEPYNTRNFLKNFSAKHRVPFDVDIFVDGTKYTRKAEWEAEERYQRQTTLDVTGTEMDVYSSRSEGNYETSWVNVELLNHGLPQAEFQISLNQPAKIPINFVVDVRSKGGPTSEEYPWLPSREGLREIANTAIKKYITQDMAAEAIRKANQLYVDTIKTAPAIKGSSRKVIDTSGQLDRKLVQRIADDPVSKQLDDGLHRLFGQIRDSVIAEEGGEASKADYKYGDYSGFGLGRDYYGVNVSGTHIFGEGAAGRNIILINPINIIEAAERLPASRKVPARREMDQVEYDPTGQYAVAEIGDRVDFAARRFAATSVHELTHQVARSHDESFSSVLTENAGRIYGKLDQQVNSIKQLLSENDYAAYKFFRDASLEVQRAELHGEDIFGKIGVSHAARRTEEPGAPGTRPRDAREELERRGSLPAGGDRAPGALAPGSRVGEPLQHTRADIAGREIVSKTADGRVVVPNEANKSGVSVVKPRTPPLESNELKLETVSRIKEEFAAGKRLWRGTKERPSDPGDIGQGTYYTTHFARAKNYGKAEGHEVALKNPLVLSEGEAYALADKYGTITGDPTRPGIGAGPEFPRMLGAERMSKEISAQGHDGIVMVRRSGDLEVVKFPVPSRVPDLASDRALVQQAGREMQRDYEALHTHKARRDGLNLANEDIARNYFTRLHRFTSTHAPEKSALVDRAEVLYSRGKFGEATALTEQALTGTHEFTNALNQASLATSLAERGIEPPATISWKATIAEVKQRMARTGPLSGGGSTFYDVNKYPEGGRPDHSKIAYILEPVIDMIKADAKRLIASGKVRAEDYVSHVRTEVNKMLAGEEFADWHPLNKSAAMGVLVDQLRKDGPPPAEPTVTAPVTEGRTKARSLPKTLEKSGRPGGTDRTYEELTNVRTVETATKRIREMGRDGAERWHRSSEPSAERTEVGRQLRDEMQVEAANMKDTEAAYELIQRSLQLTDIENVRATELGQAIQAYSMLNKYTPAGVMHEVQALAKRGHEVPAAEIMELSRLAVVHQKAEADVRRIQKKVEAIEELVGVGAGKGGGTGRSGSGGGRGRAPSDPKLDRAHKELSEATKRRASAKREIARRLAALEQSRTLVGYYRRSLNITRGLMVSQLSTAMRNLQSQVVRFEVERLTDLVEHTMRKSAGLDSDFTARNIWRNTQRQFRPSSEAHAREILSEHPAQLARMFNTHMEAGEIPTAMDYRGIQQPIARNIERVFQKTERAVEIVNYANRLQEFHLRSAEFLAELDLHTRKEAGISLEKFVKRHGIDAIPLDRIDKSVGKALEVTFSDMPAKDRAGGRLLSSLIEVGNYIPPTVSPAAFPRFMYNNLKFLYQYNPIGGLVDISMITARNRAIGKKVQRVKADETLSGQSKAAATKDLEAGLGNVPRAMARQLVGTSLFLLAHQFRNSDYAGEKWYELKFGDITLDARPFGPFSTYLFLAEAMRRWQKGEKRFTLDEVVVALGSSTAGTGVGIALVEKVYNQIAEGDWDKLQRTLKTEAGEFGRALLTPVRQIKDVVAAFDAEEAVTRETAEHPFTGPILESIPGASRGLPAAQQPTSAAPMGQTHPLVKQLTGWRVQTPKTFLQSQLDELLFTPQEIKPATGVKEIDALEERLMGPRADQLSVELEADEEFRKLGPAQRAEIIRDNLLEIREDVRSMGKQEHPELYERLKEERKPRRTRELERELESEENSPGLSSALRLGVPMPIPARRTDEDDLAYRARLIQLGRRRRTALDAVVADGAFSGASQTTRRNLLHAAMV